MSKLGVSKLNQDLDQFRVNQNPPEEVATVTKLNMQSLILSSIEI